MSLAIDVLEPSALLIVCQVLDGALLTRLRGVKPGIGGAANVRFCLMATLSYLYSQLVYATHTLRLWQTCAVRRVVAPCRKPSSVFFKAGLAASLGCSEWVAAVILRNISAAMDCKIGLNSGI